MIFQMPQQPVTFELLSQLVLTIREPYKSQVLRLTAGQALRLRREPGNPRDRQAVRVETVAEAPVGYLNAETAAFLSILLDNEPNLADDSRVSRLLTAAPPNDLDAQRLRYPKLVMQIRLRLPNAGPLFAIIAVLGIKAPDFATRFNLSGNPWLAPLQVLHNEYLTLGHDRFHLPLPLTETWIKMTQARITSPRSI